ncbi:MAG: NAD(P)-binding domain-containing protein, partial [Planctomycetota bacterium]
MTIIGDGQMGLVLADALVLRTGVRLWGPFPDQVRDLAETRQSPRRLPGFELPAAVEVEPDAGAALEDAELIINAIPTQFIRPVWERIGGDVPAGAAVVSVSKGIENGTLLRGTEVVLDALGEGPEGTRVTCVLSGPTIAAELARRMPATMVAASHDEATARLVQDLFTVEWL